MDWSRSGVGVQSFNRLRRTKEEQWRCGKKNQKARKGRSRRKEIRSWQISERCCKGCSERRPKPRNSREEQQAPESSIFHRERNANTGHGHGGEWKRTNVQDTRNTSTKGQGERRLQIRERTSATPVTGPVRCINGQKIPSERMENARSRPSRDEVALARTIRPDKSMDSLVAAIRTDSKWMISYPGNPQRSASDPHRTGPGASHDKKEEWEPRTPVAGHQSWPYQSHNAEVR